MSFPRYPAYKYSGAVWMERIPEHWEVKRVKNLFEIKKRIAGVEGYDVLSVTQQGLKVKNIESGDGQLAMDYSKYQIVEIGDFAMNHMDLLTGYVDISLRLGVTSPDYRVFSTRDTRVCFDRYYLYLFQFGYKHRLFYALGQGASHLGRWRLPADQFNSFELPFPPLLEQRAIAAFLDAETARIDMLVAKQEALIATLQEKRRALISHAVTKGVDLSAPMKDSGVPWLSEVPAHWEVKRLKHVTSFVTSGSRGWAEYYSDEGAIFLRISNLTRDSVRLDLSDIQCVSPPDTSEGKRTLVQKHDVLVSITADIGSVAVVDMDLGEAYVSQHLALTRPTSHVNPKWLGYCLLAESGKQQFTESMYGGTKLGLGLDDVRNVSLPFPPIKEQSRIVGFIEEELQQIDTLIAKAQAFIELLREHRTALIAAAVTGQIDVRGYVAEGVPVGV